MLVTRMTSGTPSIPPAPGPPPLESLPAPPPPPPPASSSHGLHGSYQSVSSSSSSQPHPARPSPPTFSSSPSASTMGRSPISASHPVNVGSLRRRQEQLSRDSAFGAAGGSLSARHQSGSPFKREREASLAAWGSKLSRSFDRMANGKNDGSLKAYVDAIEMICIHAQTIDLHLEYVTSPPVTYSSSSPSPYAQLPEQIRHTIKTRLTSASQFFGQVVVTIILRDLMILLEKHGKMYGKFIEGP